VVDECLAPRGKSFVRRQIVIRTGSLNFVEERGLDHMGQGRSCAP
jgi:hypothetical protein